MNHSYRSMEFNNYYPPAQPGQPPPGPPHGHMQPGFIAPANPNAHFSIPPNHLQQHGPPSTQRHQQPPMVHQHPHHQELGGPPGAQPPPQLGGPSPHQLLPMHHQSPTPAIPPQTHNQPHVGPPMPSMLPVQVVGQQGPTHQHLPQPPQHQQQLNQNHLQLPHMNQAPPHTPPGHHYIPTPPGTLHPGPQVPPQQHQLNPHHPHHHHQQQPQHQQQQQQQLQQQPPPPPPHHHHQQHLNHHHQHQQSHQQQLSQPGIERASPYPQIIPQTELKVMEINKRLQSRPRRRMSESALPIHDYPDESIWWQRFASEFFEDDSNLALRVILDEKQVEFNIGRTLIPKFFRTYFDGGVVDLSIKLRLAKEIAHSGMITLVCDHTDITTKNVFKHNPSKTTVDAVVHTEGRLILDFSSESLLIKNWRFETHKCHEFIDRATTFTGHPTSFLVDSVTKHGLTTRTLSYLRMCQIIEPMQILMSIQKQVRIDPRGCLKHLLYDKYKLKSIEDNRAQPSKRRKRKAPNAVAGAATGATKKKANANNANIITNSNNINNNNGNLSSSSPLTGGMPNLALTSQDAMVVGEPTMLGIDFGDENERQITRLENNQFDAIINTSSNNNSSNNSISNNTNANTTTSNNNNSSSNNNNIAIHQSPNCNNLNLQNQDQTKVNSDGNTISV